MSGSTASCTTTTFTMMNGRNIQPQQHGCFNGGHQHHHQLRPFVRIAPLPTSLPGVPSSENARFPAASLSPLDVLLKKGGRPTHGKKKFFQHCNASAEEYASFKSPIDRRLLARKLVEQWLECGGRFCVALTNPEGQESGYFRPASTEEAMQFTRRVLVRHFTPAITNKKKKDEAAAAAKKTKEQQLISKNKSKDGSGVRVAASCHSPSSTATTLLPLLAYGGHHSIELKHHDHRLHDEHHHDHLAAEAADALCFLSNVQPVHLPPPAKVVASSSARCGNNSNDNCDNAKDASPSSTCSFWSAGSNSNHIKTPTPTPSSPSAKAT